MPRPSYEDDIYRIMTLYIPGKTLEYTIELLLFTKKRILKNNTLYYKDRLRWFDLIKRIDKYINDIKQKIKNKKQEITTLEDCVICMEKFNIDDVIATPCKQCKTRAFHMQCHAQASEYSPHCPLCRYKN
jgi:hypothetical protein